MVIRKLALCVTVAVLAPAAASAQTTPGLFPRTGAARKQPADFNRNIFYKNKLEFSLEGAWLPNNIPFVFDRMLGIPDRLTGLNYTLVPFIASLRWQISNIAGPWIFRGNWETSFSGTYTMIPRGPETRYWAYVNGIRRNFIQPNWPITPYFEGRVGMGDINAKGPYGALYAQGQDLTFTIMLDAGARYNIGSRYSFSAGAAYMHISNMYLSEPKYENYGINVWGPMLGVTIRFGGERRQHVAAGRKPGGAVDATAPGNP